MKGGRRRFHDGDSTKHDQRRGGVKAALSVAIRPPTGNQERDKREDGALIVAAMAMQPLN